MKIDEETHEPEVMEGFSAYFLKFKPVILIDILNDEIVAELKRYFSPATFYFFNIDEQLGLKKVTAISKSDSCNFLTIPNEKSHLYNEESLIYS